jgi:hypothetical protein
MGYTVKKDMHHYGKKDWKLAYEESHEQGAVTSASDCITDEGPLLMSSKISDNLDKATESVKAHQVTVDSSQESQVMRHQPSSAGRHDWFYYTSTKCAIPDDMAGQQRF